MPSDSAPNRNSHRWRGFDYSAPCAYFVTVCVDDRRCLFGRVVPGSTIARGGILSTREVDEGRAAVIELSPLGRIVDECWREIPTHFPAVAIPSHVVMPNHVHGIVQITPTPEWIAKMRQLRKQEIERSKNWPVGATHASPADGGAHRARHASPLRPHGVVPRSLGAIIGSFKSAVTKRARKLGLISGPLWQRDFHDRVLRDDEWDTARRYIHMNPLRWALDRENPDRTGDDEFDRWLDS